VKRLTYILLFTLCITQLYAEPHLTRNYAYRYFTTRDGLAQMQVLCAYQDRDGFMWFGTKVGVSRYDGISFKNYTMDSGLPFGEVIQITEHGDNIVFLMRNCLVFLHPGDKMSVRYLPKNLIIDTQPNYKSIYEVDDDNLLLFNTVQIPRTGKKERFTYYQLSLKEGRLTKKCLSGYDDEMLEIRNDTFITHKTIYKLSRNPLKLIPIQKLPYVCNFACDKKMETFYCHVDEKSIVKYRRKKQGWEKLHIVCELFQPLDRFALINDSVLLYSENGKLRFYPDRDIDIDINNAFISQIYTDKEQNTWITTDDGIYKLFSFAIEEYRFGLGMPDKIWSIVEDNDDNIWLGSYVEGLWKLTPKGQLEEVKVNTNGWNAQYLNSIKSPKGELFFPFGMGLAKYENGKMELSDYKHAVLSLYYDDNTQTLYRGTANDIQHWGLMTGFGVDEKFYGWSKGYVVCFSKDANNKIRVGSFRGQGVFTGDTILEDTAKHSYQGVVCMASDKQKRMWKGTERGLFVELKDGKEYKVAGSLIKNIVLSLINYKDKYLIVGELTKLYIIDIEHLTSFANPPIWEIGYEAGFTGLESGQNGMYIDHNGDVWMTTAICVLKFNPEKLVQSKQQTIPPIRVSRLFHSQDNAHWEQRILPSNVPLSSGRGVRGEVLPSSNKFLRFEYIANSISVPKSLRFKYRLKGFSDEWSQEVYTKTAEFTNLGYGNYQFEVQCSLDGVHWSPVASSPVIQILTPFLLRWYMWLLYALLSIMLIIGITLYISKRRGKKRMELLSRQSLENELQLRTLHSKVLPHFTKNVLTAIGHFAMDDNRKAGKYIAMFSKFTQLTLANSDKNYNRLEEELNYIQTYLELEQMRFGDKFTYQTDVDVETNLKTIYIPAMTLHTYCDNAIRHGIVNKKGVGELKIVVKKTTDATVITVSDDGIGRKRSAELGTQGNQIGLKLIQQQLDFYNKLNETKITQTIVDLEDDEGNVLGTRVELFVPYGYRYSSDQLRS